MYKKITLIMCLHIATISSSYFKLYKFDGHDKIYFKSMTEHGAYLSFLIYRLGLFTADLKHKRDTCKRVEIKKSSELILSLVDQGELLLDPQSLSEKGLHADSDYIALVNQHQQRVFQGSDNRGSYMIATSADVSGCPEIHSVVEHFVMQDTDGKLMVAIHSVPVCILNTDGVMIQNSDVRIFCNETTGILYLDSKSQRNFHDPFASTATELLQGAIVLEILDRL